MVGRFFILGVTAALLPSLGCWPSHLTRIGQGADAGGDAGVIGDLATPAPFAALAPCFTENLYAVGPLTIAFGVGGTRAYSPQCLTVHEGAVVSFTGSFGTHPLRPSTRGAQPSP